MQARPKATPRSKGGAGPAAPVEASADAAEVVVVGRVTSVFGIKGWVKVASFTEPAENLLDYGPWLLNERGVWREVEVTEVARRSGRKGGFIARFGDCRDRDAAARFTGLDIGVARSELPEAGEGEYYWSDLTGCRVRTMDGVDLGVIERLFATGSNDVMVVKGEGRERLVPFTAEAVPSVDIAAGEVIVDWDPDF